LTLPGLQGQAPEAQRRREGDTVYFECPYPADTEDWYTKYWCLLADGVCQPIMSTYYGRSEQSKDGRIKIKDDITNKVVSITMAGLKAEDSGTYFCAIYKNYNYLPVKVISLNVFKAPTPGVFQGPSSTQPSSQATSLSSGNTFIILSVVLLLLLLLALVTSTALGVRHYQLLGRTGNSREAEDTRHRAEGTAQPGSTGRRESAQDASKGPAYINLDVPAQPSPEDPLYCNVEPSQAPRNPQQVEYAVIAFSQAPRNGRE
ncbi:CLM7 protein, partial [Aegithalos caudatus]|nr:CLM7 protein [Aegithalos caudatus]